MSEVAGYIDQIETGGGAGGDTFELDLGSGYFKYPYDGLLLIFGENITWECYIYSIVIKDESGQSFTVDKNDYYTAPLGLYLNNTQFFLLFTKSNYPDTFKIQVNTSYEEDYTTYSLDNVSKPKDKFKVMKANFAVS